MVPPEPSATDTSEVKTGRGALVRCVNLGHTFPTRNPLARPRVSCTGTIPYPTREKQCKEGAPLSELRQIWEGRVLRLHIHVDL